MAPTPSSAPPPPSPPPPSVVPEFEPLRTGGWRRHRLCAAMRRRRRAVAISLAVAATAMVVSAPRAEPQPPERTSRETAAGPAAELVAAPVRIADPATVRLLKPGDRVDVLASAPDGSAADRARIVARCARVAKVPESGGTGGSAGEGALVVLPVPRPTAAQLAGAAAHSRLTVAQCG
ncbi:hypothetical protein [Streptomyces gobiensis]|uniref:hypothetical protein n=1 Tax=Streptomyces gobiensis TaxID=2875706 RepID=UPI001E40AE01|nr:hypothetical protein [Streptomyces gobiensis]UGY91901.1 hypothetical protein test1122_09335 [Streptomyces gobiensis]